MGIILVQIHHARPVLHPCEAFRASQCQMTGHSHQQHFTAWCLKLGISPAARHTAWHGLVALYGIGSFVYKGTAHNLNLPVNCFSPNKSEPRADPGLRCRVIWKVNRRTACPCHRETKKFVPNLRYGDLGWPPSGFCLTGGKVCC